MNCLAYFIWSLFNIFFLYRPTFLYLPHDRQHKDEKGFFHGSPTEALYPPLEDHLARRRRLSDGAITTPRNAQPFRLPVRLKAWVVGSFGVFPIPRLCCTQQQISHKAVNTRSFDSFDTRYLLRPAPASERHPVPVIFLNTPYKRSPTSSHSYYQTSSATTDHIDARRGASCRCGVHCRSPVQRPSRLR